MTPRPALLPLALLAAFAAPAHAQSAPGHPSNAPKVSEAVAPVPEATPMPKQRPPRRAAKTMQEVLDASQASDWRRLDPQNTLYLEVDSGRVVIELALQFAPEHVAN